MKTWSSMLPEAVAALLALLCLAAVADARAPSADLATPLADDGMRCGQRLVNLGDGKVDVRDKCGKAELEETRHEGRIGADGHTVYVQIDEWTYSLERHQFRRIVTFEQGRVSGIRVGSQVP